jgi:hypothetical protein
MLVGVVKVMNGQNQLLVIVAALRAASRLAGCLNGWQQQSHQHANDRNHHKQLDERKAFALGVTAPLLPYRSHVELLEAKKNNK